MISKLINFKAKLFLPLVVFIFLIIPFTTKAANSSACVNSAGNFICSAGNKSDCSDIAQGVCQSSCRQIDQTLCNQSAGSTNGNPGSPNIPPAGSTMIVQFPKIIPDTDILALFLRLLKLAMGILGVLAVAMIVFGGFQITLSRGNEEAYTKGKNTVTWAVVGLIVALLSFSLIAIAQNVLQADLPDANTQLNQAP